MNCEKEPNIEIRNIGLPFRQSKCLNDYQIILNYDAQIMQVQHVVNNMFQRQHANVEVVFA